jgi:ATP-binding cassette, subfamily B, bacterial
LGIGAAAILVRAATQALQPWPLKWLVDNLTGHAHATGTAWISGLPAADSFTGFAAWLAFGTVLLFAAGAAASVVQRFLQASAGARISYALAADVFDHVQRLPLAYHTRRKTGDVLRRVTIDTMCLRDLLAQVLYPVLGTVAGVAIPFALMWLLDPLLALVVVVVAIPAAVLVQRSVSRMTERDFLQQQMEGQVMAFAEQTLSVLPAVQAFGREPHEDQRFRALSGQTISAALRATALHIGVTLATGGVLALGAALVIAVGGFAVLDGRLTLGSLLVFIAYVYTFQSPVQQMAGVAASYATAAGSARRVVHVLGEDEGVQDALHARPLRTPVHGHVRVENATFGYHPGRPVLHEVSFEAGPGEMVALVGQTGAGKTTAVSLIPRFFDPWSGRVLFDGADIRDVTLASLRGHVSLVLQDALLLPITIAENIAYGRPDAGRDAVVAAAVAAEADEFIRRLPDGYETVVDERGAGLSGGERQRVSIARALLKDSPVVIMDEPTSALDAETEARLLAAVERLVERRTTLVIAHRLSTARRADRIIVLERGRVIENGSHDELVAAGGAYARMHMLQLRGGLAIPAGGHGVAPSTADSALRAPRRRATHGLALLRRLRRARDRDGGG